MLSRRNFLGAIGLPAAGAFAMPELHPAGLERALRTAAAIKTSGSTPEEVAQDEEYWFEIQQAFTADRTLVNLNNGGVCPAPAVVQEAMKRYLDYSNTAPVYSMWRILEPQRETVRKRLARSFGCESEEIALTRNASESLQICQFGFDLKAGDEVLTTTHDYPRMITTWKQRERREGIRLRQFSIPVPAEDPSQIVRLFEENITPRTKLILISHIVNITGQILPVKEVVEMARRHQIPVIVDGAHAYAHFDFKQEDLNCDYYGSSLHKWLFAPHGTGLLYVRREKIKALWPLMAATDKQDPDIRKFEEIGTHPAANYLAIGDALTFHQGLGPRRKTARLRYLTRYWSQPLLEMSNVRLHTSLKPGLSCGIANVEIVGVDPRELTTHLWQEHRIIVVAINHEDFQGIRVTPSVYTTLEELDRFIDAMTQVAKKGLPAQS